MSKFTPCLLLVTYGACLSAPRVAIPPLRPGLSPEQRVATFQQYVPRAEEKTFVCNRNGCEDANATLYLGNGLAVNDPRDLVPLVPGGEVARQSAAYDHDVSSAKGFSYAGLASMVAGILLVGHGVGSQAQFTDRDAEIFVGLEVLGLVGLAISHSYANDVVAERNAAYGAFRRELAQRLNVCVAGYAVVACEAPPAPPQPPPPPQPIE